MNNRKSTTFHWSEQQQKGNRIHPTIQTTELPPFTCGFQTDTHNQEYYPKDVYYNLTSPVSLQYRESLNSAGSSLSRHSTVSSINTTCSFFSTAEPSSASSPSSLTDIHLQPTSYFVPYMANNSSDKTSDYHYVVPTFAMAGKNQAQILQLLFNYDDPNAEKLKEEYERSFSWTISTKRKNLIVTLSQNTFNKSSVQQVDPSDLGHRLGITSILILVSLQEIQTIDILLDNLIQSMNSNTNKLDDDWWNRVILVIDQPLEDMSQISLQRKDILYHVMPDIQKRYQLSKPLSLLFLNSQDRMDDEYRLQCQEILCQMLDIHNQSGRWSDEVQLNDVDDSTSSDEDDSPYQTVIEYIGGVRKKEPKKKNSLLQRREVQKLHSYDDDTAPPTPPP